APDYRAIRQAKREYLQRLMSLPAITSPAPLKVGITGEFFVVIDPFTNMDIEIELGKLGVEVRCHISISESGPQPNAVIPITPSVPLLK
ncbi:unnamed protein product, partial [marine sediment metagenome]